MTLLAMPIVEEHLRVVEPLDNDLRKVLGYLESNAHLWRGKSVLVVGCLEEPVSNALALLGCSVTGVDVREYGYGDFSSGLDKPAYKHVVCNYNEWESNETFDLILAISSVEHFGLGYYKETRDESADLKAVAKMRLQLKKSGRIILTVPYSNQPKITPHWRSYDKQGLEKLIGGLKVLASSYFFTGYTGQHDATEEDVRGYKGGADLSVMLILE